MGKSSEAPEDASLRRSRMEADASRDPARSPAKPEADSRSLEHSERLRRLYEISTLLTGFESAERTVPRLLELVARALPLRSLFCLLADGRAGTACFVWKHEGESGARLRAAEAHARSVFRYLVDASDDGDAGGEDRGPIARSDDENRIALPLVIAGQPAFGVLQLGGAMPFDEVDLIFVNAITNQLAIALDRQRVIDANQASAEANEREQRLLADVSAVVGSSLDYRETLATLARSTVPQFADLFLIDEIDRDGKVERLEVHFADEGKQRALAERMRQLPRRAHARLLPSRPMLVEGADQLVAVGFGEKEGDALREAGIESMMVVPLVARGQRLGVLTFAMAESGRRYSARELGLAEELARRAAIAIDNARLYEQAQQAMLARENLLAVVSHDLRNPLGTILIGLSILLDAPEGEGGSRSRKALLAALRSAKRMNRMLEDLLQTASIEGGGLSVDRKRLDLAALVVEATEALQPLAASKSQRLVTEVPADLPPVLADAARIHQVFANLVGNAIKFTPDGGSITIRATPAHELVTISVADTGTGISADELPHVFDRFWQAGPAARLGTGLGLFIVRGIVEAHGGRVWAESEPGAGSTFHFTLPVAP